MYVGTHTHPLRLFVYHVFPSPCFQEQEEENRKKKLKQEEEDKKKALEEAKLERERVVSRFAFNTPRSTYIFQLCYSFLLLFLWRTFVAVGGHCLVHHGCCTSVFS